MPEIEKRFIVLLFFRVNPHNFRINQMQQQKTRILIISFGNWKIISTHKFFIFTSNKTTCLELVILF